MKRPVLILGNEPRVALTIARSLYARGVPVDVASLTDDAPRLASRAVRRHLCVPGQLDRPDEFREPLEERIAEAGYDTLIPSSDTALALVSGCYEALSRRLHVGCPSPAVLRRVLDKDQTLEIARSVGILTPESYPIADASQLEAIRDRLRFPVVAKDRSKSLMQSSTFKVRYFSTYDALVSAFREDPGLGSRVLFQEYCPGVGVGVAMLMRNGEALAAFQHRRLKELPVTGGVAVMAISERLDPELARQSLVLLRTLEWEGVGMVEFRHDRSTGRPVLMEVNGRYWGTCSLAMACGLDFPYNQWQVIHGQGLDVPPSYRTGVTWRWTAGYLQRLHELVATPVADNLPRPSAWREILGSAADLGPWNRSAVGSLRDPVPGLLEAGRTALALLAGDARRLARRALPRGLKQHLRTLRWLTWSERRRYVQSRAIRCFGLRRDRPGSDQLRSARSILFVCHGNIIRSPTAEAMLCHDLAILGRDSIAVASVGVHAREGRPADERAILAANELGFSLIGHRAKPLTGEIVDWADLIFVMDYQNEARLLARFPHAASKVFLLGSFGQWERQSAVAEIPDPYSGNLDDVLLCLREIQSCVSALSRALAPGELGQESSRWAALNRD